jgi:outer membrane protein assembly factor BamD
MNRFISMTILLASTLLLIGCGSSKPPELPTAEGRFHEGMVEYNDENYFEAIQHFEVIRIQYPGSAYADSARFYSGMSRYHREEYLLASYEFGQLIQNIPSSPLVPEAQYMIAECYVQLSPGVQLDQVYTIKAINELQTFMELYPNHPRIEQARKDIITMYDKLAEKEFNTGVLYKGLDNYASATIYFDTIIDRYYNTSYVDDAMVEKLSILMLRKKWAEGSRLAEQFLAKYQDSPFVAKVERMKMECDGMVKTAGK